MKCKLTVLKRKLKSQESTLLMRKLVEECKTKSIFWLALLTKLSWSFSKRKLLSADLKTKETLDLMLSNNSACKLNRTIVVKPRSRPFRKNSHLLLTIFPTLKLNTLSVLRPLLNFLSTLRMLNSKLRLSSSISLIWSQELLSTFLLKEILLTNV